MGQCHMHRVLGAHFTFLVFLSIYFSCYLNLSLFYTLVNPSSERAFKEAGQPDRALHEWMALLSLKGQEDRNQLLHWCLLQGLLLLFLAQHQSHYICDFIIYTAIFCLFWHYVLIAYECRVVLGVVHSRHVFWACFNTMVMRNSFKFIHLNV